MPVLRLGVGSLLSARTVAPALRFLRFLRREHIDAVQAYFPDSTYVGVPLAWLAGVPWRLRTRNNSGHWTTRLHRILGRCVNRLTTATLTNCNAARDSLLRDEGPDAATVHVFENGVDLQRFEQIPAYCGGMSATFRIGVVANLRPVKGLDVLVDAAALLAKQQTTFAVDIIGEGSERESLQRQIDAAGLTATRRGCTAAARGRAGISVAARYCGALLAGRGLAERGAGIHGGGSAHRGHACRCGSGDDRRWRSRPARVAQRCRRPCCRGPPFHDRLRSG